MNGGKLVDESKELGLDKNHRRAFYKVLEFPKLLVFEEKFFEIKNELLKILNETNYEKDFFEAWCEKELYDESNPEGWQVAPLIINGKHIPNNLKKVPFLLKILDQIKGIVTASYSLLKPNTWIVPHRGYENYSDKILRLHIGLIIPKGDVGLRVNKIQTKWVEGKGIIFDDSMIHEAWNYTEENRYVLIIDFARNDNLDLSLVQYPELLLTDKAKSFVNQKN